MKRIIIAVLMLIFIENTLAQGPVYNFSFYNNTVVNSESSETKVKNVKAERLYGIELSYGSSFLTAVDESDFGDEDCHCQSGLVASVFRKFRGTSKFKLGFAYESLSANYENIAMKGINLNVGNTFQFGNIFGLTLELEGQVTFGKSDYDSTSYQRWYGGINVGPQLSFGNVYLSAMAKVGIDEFESEDGWMPSGGFAYGFLVNTGIVF